MINTARLSDLIAVLATILAKHGDGPIAIWDQDTGLQLPLEDVHKTADGWYLINGIGYECHGIRYPEPLTQDLHNFIEGKQLPKE